MTVRHSRRNPPRGAPECAGNDPGAAPRPCEHPGCTGPGLYPAPRSRRALRSWRWFCLTHVREYNRRWNYFEGCDEAEIGREVREDLGWQRPTWPPAGAPGWRVADRFGFLGGARRPPGTAPGGSRGHRCGERLTRALDVFGLCEGASLPTVKARYKSLVKSHHPDANDGDAGATDRLIRINAAYAVLLDHHREA